MPHITWLDSNEPDFPSTSNAFSDPEGLLAAGGKLDVNWLRAAYKLGIFPWFNDGDPILWWSPTPRMVLYPDQLRINKTLKRHLRKTTATHISFDQAFELVISRCAERKFKEGTWITDEMEAAYIQAHKAGLAHSVEIWQEDNLVGGLYGIALGSVFFGESMFSEIQSASRFAIMALLKGPLGITMLDCQIASSHIEALGAINISRVEFETHLQKNTDKEHIIDWQKTINFSDFQL